MINEAKTVTSKAELRRQQILDAAAECFRKSGFHGASMSEIAKSFGMSAGHIYNYFESKEAIIEAMVKRDLDQALERIAKIQGEKDILKAMLGTVAVIREKVTHLIKGIQPLKDSPPCELNLAAKSTILMALFDGLQIRAIRDPDMKADDIARVLKSVIQQMLQS